MIPRPIAEQLQIDDRRALAPERTVLAQELQLRQKPSRCSTGSLATALRELDVMEGDFIFLTVAPTSYDLFARHRREVAATDPLGRLLWGCGIDPANEAARRAPWRAAGRAIGGAEPDRESIRRRLIERHNLDLVTALDEIRAGIRPMSNIGPWPEGWEFTSSLIGDASVYAVCSSSGPVRIAIGLATPDTDNGEYVIDDTGIAWLELPEFDSTNTPFLPPPDVAAVNQRWVEWKRAEHHAVRVALAGTAWEVRWENAAWHLDGNAHHDLAAALTAVRATADHQEPMRSNAVARSPSLRSGFAYDRLVNRAIDDGLRAIQSNPSAGMTAVFDGLGGIDAARLADALSPAS